MTAQLHMSQHDVTLGIAKNHFSKQSLENAGLREAVGKSVG